MSQQNKKPDTPGDDFLNDAISDITYDDDALSEPANDFSNSLNDAPKKNWKEKLKDLWRDPKKRKVTITILVVLLVLVIVIPHSRYFILNTVGVRSSASVRVLDQSTGQPLKNVTVKIAGVEGKSNDDGVAKIERIKLGRTDLLVEKRAFATKEQKITIGWGSNPLGDFKVEPRGLQYSFKLTDYLSGKPIEKAEAVSGEYSAFSNEEGIAVITIEDPGEDVIKIDIQADGYRTEPVDQMTENKDIQDIVLVPDRKHVFVSKRSGKYDVYKIDIDGKNEELVLSGTGNEKEDMMLVAHPERNLAALVSSRDNVRNKDGFLLNTLTLIDLSGDTVITESLATSERIQIVDWHNEHLLYVRIAEGASAATPDRHRLVTYNTDTGSAKQIASSNYFNDVLMIKNKLYYAPSSVYQNQSVGLHRVDPNGENNETLFEQEVWNIFRTDFNQVMFSVNNHWYEYRLDDNQLLAASGPPAIQLSRLYMDGPEDKRSIWIDQRDGKGTLLAYNVEDKEDKTILAQSGLTYPVRWMNDSTIIYRINTDQEIADYAVSLDGGEPKKISDVTNTGGVDRWYYY